MKKELGEFISKVDFLEGDYPCKECGSIERLYSKKSIEEMGVAFYLSCIGCRNVINIATRGCIEAITFEDDLLAAMRQSWNEKNFTGEAWSIKVYEILADSGMAPSMLIPITEILRYVGQLELELQALTKLKENTDAV